MPSKRETETAKLKRLLAAEKRKKAVETAKLKRLMAAEKAKKEGKKTPPIARAPRGPRRPAPGRRVPLRRR